MMKAIACLCLLVAVVSAIGVKTPVAADPTTPVFPNQFSASLLFTFTTNDTTGTNFGRWFYDAKLAQERYDTTRQVNGETAFDVSIRDRVKNLDYTVAYIGDTVYCSEYNASYIPPLPVFDSYYFSGVSLVNYVPVNVWISTQSSSNATLFYYETTKSREPVRMVTVLAGYEPVTYTYTFYEMDEAPQDPAIFVLSDPIQAICDANNSKK